MARGANTGAEPSPSRTLPWLWVAASRSTFSPERMARGANTGAEPSPSRTLPWLWVAASRSTLSPTTGRRAFTISCMECILFYESPPSWYPTAYKYWDRTPTRFRSCGHRGVVLALAGLEYGEQG